MTDALQQLHLWVAMTRSTRTAALEAGTGQIDWVDPGTRVSWSEVWAKAEELGITLNPVELRLELDRLDRQSKEAGGEFPIA